MSAAEPTRDAVQRRPCSAPANGPAAHQSIALVFSGLTRGGADERFGHNFSKWFSRYRREVNRYRRGRDFHSLRHSATTFLQWAGVPVPVIDQLTGHSTAGETARYTKRFEIGQLKGAIDKI